MAAGISCINEITPEKDEWKIRVRVVRMWKQHAYMKPSEVTSLDMLLMDEEGQKIHATIKKHLFTKFEPVLQEGSVYVIGNFGVVENTAGFKMAKHPYKINFYRMTSVKPYGSQFRGSQYGLEFRQFDDILTETVDYNHAFDIIGRIVTSDGLAVFTKDGKSIKKISFEMAALDGLKVNYTLWDELAQQLANFIASMSNDTHVILVVQLARVRSWNGGPVITSCYYGTRILINSEAEEIADLKSRMVRNAFGSRVPTLASESMYSICDAFVTDTEKKHVEEIRELKKKDQDWYYLACRKCKKGVEADEADGGKEVWMCPKCDKNGVDVVHRFKLQVHVQDITGLMSLLLFDEVVGSIIKKSASEILAKNQMESEADYYPEELNELVGKKFVFKIHVDRLNISKSCRVYTVIRMTDDEEVMSKLLENNATRDEENLAASGSSTTPKTNGKRCFGMTEFDNHVE